MLPGPLGPKPCIELRAKVGDAAEQHCDCDLADESHHVVRDEAGEDADDG